MNLSAVILAGGASRRMGRDKAWIEAEGQTWVARAIAVARGAGADEVIISGREGVDYSGLGCPVVLDLEPGFGPLAGIERGLWAARSPLLLVLAVDLPRMTVACLQKLARRCDRLTGAIPKLNAELEPLAAIYPKRCHAIAFNFIVQSRHAVRDFADTCLREHAARTVAVTPSDFGCFANWNTPTDLSASVSCRKSGRIRSDSGPLCP